MVEFPVCSSSPPLYDLLIGPNQAPKPPLSPLLSFVVFFQTLTEVATHFVTIEKNLLCAIIYETAY